MDVRTFEFPQVLPGGFRLPARMTVLPLEEGVAVISPIPIDEAWAATLGSVRYLVAPNLLHHLYLGAAAARFPAAEVLAPRALASKRPDLSIHHALEDGLPEPLGRVVDVVKIEGAPSVDEFAFFHRPSRTLVLTDLVFNVTRPEGWMAHVVLGVVGCRGHLAQSRAWRWLFVKNRAAAAASAARLLSFPFDALIVAHGEPVETDARAALDRALAPMRRA